MSTRMLPSRSWRDHIAGFLWARRGTRGLVKYYAFHSSRLHVVSYPKSGRTWLRFLLGMSLCEQFGVDPPAALEVLEIHRLARLDRRIPSIRFSHDDTPQNKRPSELERDKRRYRSRDVVFLARDPRDIVVSSYFHHKHRAPHFGELSFHGTISEFLRDPVFGIATIVEFMNIWASNRGVPRRFLLVRYEDLLRDTEAELVKVLRLAGVDPLPDAVSNAVAAGRFENMRRLEEQDALGSDRLRPIDSADSRSFKVRRGVAGSYAEDLGEDDKAYVNDALRGLNSLFAYEVQTS